MMVLLFCSGNPFFKDKVSGGNLKITGKVTLNGETDSENIFVWLEGFDVSASTDADGHFELMLAAPQHQPGGGLTGEYRLFYYVANYAYETVGVIVRDGLLVYGEGGLDQDGNVRLDYSLNKLLDVSSTVTPAEIVQHDSVTLVQVGMTLSPYSTAFSVKTLLGPEPARSLMGYFFRRIDGTDSTIIIHPCDRPPVTMQLPGTRTWTGGSVGFEMGLIGEPATYECIPYVILLQPGLPDALFNRIHPLSLDYGLDYLKIPIRWKKLGQIVCTPAL